MIFLALFFLLAGTASGFERALPGRVFEFPRDHFSHPEFELEWWYYTGNLRASTGRRFGFELTFFRRAVERDRPVETPWEIDQYWLAHFAVSDIESGRFLKTERVNRSGPGLAGASHSQALIWNGNWRVRWLDLDDPTGAQELRAISDEAELALELRPAKQPVVNGVDGVSQKASGEGRASYYISFTRLETSGRIVLNDESYEVEGLAWMDHEFSTASMGPGQAGWDWLSIQLDDGSDLLLYRLRSLDGSVDVHSSGTYVDPGGRALHLRQEDFVMTPGRTWRSEVTGGEYPVQWRIEAPGLGLRLEVTTLLDGQEVVAGRSASPNYWEGAVDYRGELRGKVVNGAGYLEMTGYDKPIQLGGR